MPFLDVLRIVHCPVSTDGNLLKNCSGIVLAACADTWTAAALAELVNLGVPQAELNRHEYENRLDNIIPHLNKTAKGVTAMSAFIVSDDTLNRVMSILEQRAHYLGCFRDTDFDRKLSVEILSSQLHAMNVRSVNIYYDLQQEVEPYLYKSKFPVSDIIGYKSVQCLLYQCDSGYEPDTHLLKELEKFEASLASLIISDLPAYRAAPWD